MAHRAELYGVELFTKFINLEKNSSLNSSFGNRKNLQYKKTANSVF